MKTFHKNIFRLIYFQRDPNLHGLFFMENCSTCFGCYLHPSSGAYNFIYSIWYFQTVKDKSKLLVKCMEVYKTWCG